jgi:hypothetical protein
MSVKPKLPSGKGAKYEGALRGKGQSEKFDSPMSDVPMGIENINSLHNDIGEMSGFEGRTDAYIVKKGTPYGEAAKFNFLPPGMDISHQENKDIRDMPLKKITGMGYDGDGWEPMPRDIKEVE